MVYTSVFYLALFLLPVWLAWALLPQRLRPFALLAGSMVFYLLNARQYTLWLLLTAAAVHLAARRLAALDAAPLPEGTDAAARKAAKARCKAAKRRTVGMAAGACLGLLLVLKYLPFAARTANALLERLPGGLALPLPGWAAPLGLSFFSLMAVGYLVDVYRGDAAPAGHYWQVLLFLSFWPHIVEGPFDRWGTLSPALLDPPRPSWQALCFGAQRIAWGMAKKMVIADRANMYVNAVFNHWEEYSRRCCMLCSSTPNFPAAWTWCAARPRCSACRWRRISASPSLPARWASSGAAGTSPSAPGCGPTCSSRWS